MQINLFNRNTIKNIRYFLEIYFNTIKLEYAEQITEDVVVTVR